MYLFVYYISNVVIFFCLGSWSWIHLRLLHQLTMTSQALNKRPSIQMLNVLRINLTA